MHRCLTGLLLCITAGCTSIERATLPDPTLLDTRWQAAATTDRFMVDHSQWDRFLARYVSTDAKGINRLDYSAVTAQDRAALRAYLAHLQSVTVTALSRDRQLAYWINLYNAKTVDLVLDAYPVASILDIKDGLLPTGPWNREVVTVEGQTLSLNDIEHRIIRPVFNEPRIHYALNCAATACPNLAPKAWRAEGLDTDLSTAERAYVNDPRGLRIDPDGRLIASKIYAWFREDFGANDAEILARLQKSANPALRQQLSGRTRIDRYDYDWSLNDAALP